jgi:multiple sugar transport system substrate-binding protein
MQKLAITILFGAAFTALGAAAAWAETKVQLVEVITSPQRTEFLKSQLAEFAKANPDIKVDVVSLPWGQAFEKFLSMVQAGETPDIVEMPERWMGLYANNNQLENLGPYMKDWPEAATLGDRAKEFGSMVNNTQYMIPYGYYARAMFWNKKLFAEAGLAGPPKTVEEFVDSVKKIAALGNGKTGYCLRGGPGAFGGIQMFMNIMNGKPGFFNEDGTSTFNEEGSVKALEMLQDLYMGGHVPKDSISWGFNEIVTGFYTGTCAMLDQDPDALIGVAEKMKPEDFSVAPMPLGPNGRSYPTLGFAGWSMFADSTVKPEAWKVIAFLSDNKQNLGWAKVVGVLPIHNGADQDAHFKTEQFKGWFDELSNPDKYVFVTQPAHLENLGVFYDSMVPKGFQELLLGKKKAKEVADEWATFLTAEQQKYLATKK